MTEGVKRFGLRLWLALCLTLVLMQTLGLAHRVVHANAAHGVAVTAETAVATFSQDAVTVMQRLWGDHSHTADCQLFDQCCSDVLHTMATLAVPMLPAPSWLAATAYERFGLSERFYAARGPPAVLL